MVTFNRKEFTQKCLKYLSDRTKTPLRIIVVDNNSDDGSQEMLFKMKQNGLIHHLILLEENYGIHMAKNYGLSLVRSEPYYIDTDNDLLCSSTEPDWVSRLVSLMERYPKFGAIACRPQVLVGTGGGQFKEEEVVKFGHVGGHLRIMNTKLVRKVGGWAKVWDAKRNSEDKWIAERIREAGLEVGYASDVRCWHMFGENWGYKDMPVKDHGHNEMWPPPEHWDRGQYKFDHYTWKEKDG